MEEHSTKYLIHIRFDGDDVGRIAGATKKARETLNSLSNNKIKLAYTTPDGKSLGIIARINKPASVIRAAVDGSADITPDYSAPKSPKITTGLLNTDKIFVLEVGQDFSHHGCGQLLAWLQHN